jgi:hypothetical protein
MIAPEVEASCHTRERNSSTKFKKTTQELPRRNGF